MAEKMSVVKFLTHPTYGCASSGEIIKYSREDKMGFATLKQWAEEEMTARGIEIEKPATSQ